MKYIALVISISMFAFFLIKKIQLNRECKKLRYQNINHRIKMQEKEMRSIRLHCTKIAKCTHVTPSYGVRKWVAYKGCPASAYCDDFESVLGKHYIDTCACIDPNEGSCCSLKEHREYETSQCPQKTSC